jgi:hypothetical protein
MRADTPGVHLQHRLQHLLEGNAVKALLPRGPLKAFVPPTPQQLATRMQAESGSASRCAGLPDLAATEIHITNKKAAQYRHACTKLHA